MKQIEGFEVRLAKNDEGVCLYITNRLATGKVSLIIGEERPSVADVYDGKRWDVSEKGFAELWKRVDHKLTPTVSIEKVYEPEEPTEIEEEREETIEIPEISKPIERAVRKPRGRRPRVPKPVIK